MSNIIFRRAGSMTLLVSALTYFPICGANNALPGTYKIDPDHSSMQFSIGHLGFSELLGRFNTFSGSIVLKPKGESKVDVAVKTASVDTNHGKRDEHLRSPDFLNAKQFPDMHFVSKRVTFDTQGRPVLIEGELTLLGKTKPATMKVSAIGAGKDPWGGYRAGYNATAVIKRSEYGMNFMQGEGGVGDDINITLKIEATKQ